MTLIQLQYLLAIAQHRNFTLAAEKCFVTQPTLSMQIQKLEAELGVALFDRSSHPISLTPMGEKIVEKSKDIISGVDKIKDFIAQKKGVFAGEFRVGIIPTVMPSLLPLFLNRFVSLYPEINLKIEEFTTKTILTRLREYKLDAAIVATPIEEDGITGKVLYYEPFVAYVSPKHKLSPSKREISVEDFIDDHLLLLEEGHCFRDNVLNLCKEYNLNIKKSFEIKSGSFEVLLNLCDMNMGITLLPYLHTLNMDPSKMENIRFFKDPKPAREVSLVYNNLEFKKHIINALHKVIEEVAAPILNFKKIKVFESFV